MKVYNDRWRESNREKNRQYQREWQATERRKTRNQANYFLRTYGLTLEQREEMIREQDSKCYLCFRDLPLHVDHDAETGIVRKMLCGSCNRGIGQLQHDADLLRRAALYIEEHGMKVSE